MQKLPVVQIVAWLVLLPLSQTQPEAQDTATQKQAAAQEPTLLRYATDFQTDCRAEFQLTGQVDWQPGKLTLQPQATVSKQVNGNWQGAWQFQLDYEQSTEAEPAEFFFQGIMDEGATPWFLLFSMPRQGAGTLTLFDSVVEENQLRVFVIKQAPLQAASGTWQVHYSAGIVQVQQNGQEILFGYLANNTCGISSAQWHSKRHRLTLFSWQQQTTPASMWTETQKQQIQQAIQLNRKVVSLWEEGQSLAALPLAKQSLQLRLEVYGALHPETALGYFNLGAQYLALTKYEQAVPLYQQAVAITERSLGKEHPKTADALNKLFQLYEAQGAFAEAELVCQRALAIRERSLGKDHPDTAQSLNNLAALLQTQGKYTEAEPLHQRALAIREQCLGKDHPDTAQSLNNLAALLKNQGKHSEAELLFERVLEITEQSFGPQAPYTALVLNHLATLCKDQGKLTAAELLFHRTLAIHEQIFGESHAKTTSTMQNLADVFSDLGKKAAAELMFQRIVTIQEQTLGPDHPETATNMNYLGVLFHDQGKYAEAEPLLQRALEVRERSLGIDHLETAQSLFNLATLYHSQKKYVAAEPLAQRALAIYEKSLATDHANFIECLNLLAEIYKYQRKYALAELLLQRVLAICEQLYGKSHLELTASLIHLASLYDAQGKYAAAEPLLQRALAIREQNLGKDHPETANSLNNLAVLYNAQGKYAAAESLLQRALAIYEQKFGKNHPETVIALGNLASLYNAQGKSAAAEPLLQRALTIWEQTHGENHPKITISLNNLAALYQDQGKYTKAEPLLQRALAIREQNLGKDHLETANSLNNLAALYQDQGKYAAAEPLFQRALAIFEHVLGKDHPEAANTINNLATLFSAQGKFAEAEPLLKRALAIREQTLGMEHPSTANSLHNLAVLYNKQRNYAEAELLFQHALATLEKILGQEHADLTLTLNNLAKLYESQGKSAAAESFYQRGLRIVEKSLGEEHPNTVTLLNNLASLYESQGKFAEAESCYRRALAIVERLLGGDHPNIAALLNNLARLSMGLGKYVVAESYFLRAIAIVENTRGLRNDQALFRSLDQSQFHPYQGLTHLHLRLNHAQQAWSYWENSLGRALLDELNIREQRLLATEQRQQLQQLMTRCQALQRLIEEHAQIPTCDAELQQQWQSEFQQQTAALTALRRQLAQQYEVLARQSYSLQQIQPQLLPHQALVGWFDMNNSCFGIVVRSHGAPLWVQLPDRESQGMKMVGAKQLVPTVAQQLAQFPLAETPGLLAKLRQQRVEPLMPLLQATETLPAVTHWIVLPSPGLRGIPIETIAPDHTQISYCSSGTIFAWLREQRQSKPSSNNNLLALGDPVFSHLSPSEQRGINFQFSQLPSDHQTSPATSDSVSATSVTTAWASLPGTRREVEQLTKLAKQHNLAVTALLGSDASEQRLHQFAQADQLRQYGYLHFATHGLVNDQFPLRSKLILSRDALPDPIKQLQSGQPVFCGELTAETILQDWNLHAELVVLSACQTGLGQYTESEGYMGLTQPLLLAGARSVVVSLWNVEDTATQLLMSRFYEKLWGLRDGLDQSMSKVAALHEAKQWLRSLDQLEVVQQVQQRGLQLQMASSLSSSGSTTHDRPTSSSRPFAEPHYWAAFILVGDWQ